MRYCTCINSMTYVLVKWPKYNIYFHFTFDAQYCITDIACNIIINMMSTNQANVITAG